MAQTINRQMRNLRADGFEFKQTLPTQSAPVLPKALKDWRKNSHPYSMPVGVTDLSTPARAELSRLMNLVARSETGRLLLDAAYRGKVWITYDDEQESRAYFDDLGNYIALKRKVNPDGTLPRGSNFGRPGELVSALVHELRHAWQSTRGDYFQSIRYRPADAALIKRHLEADAEAVTAQICWELKALGWDKAWKADKGWYKDIYQAYATQIRRDPRAHDNGRALAAAHQQWFKNDNRVDFYDRWTLSWWGIDFDAMPSKGPIKPVHRPMLTKLGAWGKGRNYMKGDHFPDVKGPGFTAPLSSEAREKAEQLNRKLAQRLKYRPINQRPRLKPTLLERKGPGLRPVSPPTP